MEDRREPGSRFSIEVKIVLLSTVIFTRSCFRCVDLFSLSFALGVDSTNEYPILAIGALLVCYTIEVSGTSSSIVVVRTRGGG